MGCLMAVSLPSQSRLSSFSVDHHDRRLCVYFSSMQVDVVNFPFSSDSIPCPAYPSTDIISASDLLKASIGVLCIRPAAGGGRQLLSLFLSLPLLPFPPAPSPCLRRASFDRRSPVHQRLRRCHRSRQRHRRRRRRRQN